MDPCSAFDDGLGGFLPLSEADLPVRPAVARVRGHRPGADQPDGDGRGRLRGQADPARPLPPLAARRGRGAAGACAAGARRAPGDRDHPRPRRRRPSGRPRRMAALELATQGLAAAWPLGSSLRSLPRAVGAPRAARVVPRRPLPGPAPRRALPRDVPGQHRHPELHRPPGQRRPSRHHRGHPARQPAAADLRPGLPGAVRVRLRARRQRRRRLHPAAEGQGGRALPR